MVWHFFRKDVRLCWPLALAVVAIQVLCALRTSVLGYFDQPIVLERATFFFPLLVYLGIAVAAVTVVHQEPLSGTTQGDWLIRPIRRRDLAWSKILFVILTVNVPLMIVDVVQQLALHFPVSVSIGVALSRFLIMVAFSLAALALGAVTRSLIDAFVFGVVSAMGFALLIMIATSGLNPVIFGIGGQPGMAWISVAAAALIMSAAAAFVLAFQYRTRRTFAARGFGLSAFLLAFCTYVCFPRTAAIAAQEVVWGTSAGREVSLSFDSDHQAAQAGSAAALSANDPATVPAVVAENEARQVRLIGRQVERIRLPLNIDGLPAGNVLVADRVVVRIMAETGKVLYQGASVCRHPVAGSGVSGVGCLNNGLEIWSQAAKDPKTATEQRLNLPAAVYDRIKDAPVRVEVLYVLTRFAPRPSHTISAAGGLQPLPEMGTCATRIDDDGDEVELNCLTNVGVPSCAGVVLEDPQTHKRNPELHMCRPSYGPFHREAAEEAVRRSELSIPFRDLSGLAHYPVDGAAIERAQVIVTAYDPVAHFRSTVAIPNIRLADWQLPSGSN
jgi:hypothetical protein